MTALASASGAPLPAPAVEPRFTAAGALADVAIEARFRAASLAADARGAGTTVLVAQVANVLILNDYRLFGTGPVFWSLLAMRAAWTALSLAVTLSLLRGTSVVRHDRSLMAWGLFTVALNTVVTASRPTTMTSQFLFTTVIILLFYMAITLPLSRQAGLAVLAGVLALAVAGLTHPDGGAVQWTGLAVIVLGTNVLGALTSRARHAGRRREFVALVAERDLRERLEHATSQIRSLEGILPICAHCRRLRDESGAWRPLEAYIRERTNAEFSHGICPECTVQHFPGV